MLVFSMDCRESFEEAIRLREAILESKVSATQGAKGRKSHHSLKVPMVIVGNKCDRETKCVDPSILTLILLLHIRLFYHNLNAIMSVRLIVARREFF